MLVTAPFFRQSIEAGIATTFLSDKFLICFTLFGALEDFLPNSLDNSSGVCIF
jgi:hypothetical protein